MALDSGADGPQQRSRGAACVTTQFTHLSWSGNVCSLGVGLTCFWSSVRWWHCPLCWPWWINCSFSCGDRGDLFSRLCLVGFWCGSRPVCVCLSVSCQWFYPMVGYVMLFYHRVEPRTGYRGTLCIEGLRICPATNSPAARDWPRGDVPCWFSSSPKGL